MTVIHSDGSFCSLHTREEHFNDGIRGALKPSIDFALRNSPRGDGKASHLERRGVAIHSARLYCTLQYTMEHYVVESAWLHEPPIKAGKLLLPAASAQYPNCACAIRDSAMFIAERKSRSTINVIRPDQLNAETLQTSGSQRNVGSPRGTRNHICSLGRHISGRARRKDSHTPSW